MTAHLIFAVVCGRAVGKLLIINQLTNRKNSLEQGFCGVAVSKGKERLTAIRFLR